MVFDEAQNAGVVKKIRGLGRLEAAWSFSSSQFASSKRCGELFAAGLVVSVRGGVEFFVGLVV